MTAAGPGAPSGRRGRHADGPAPTPCDLLLARRRRILIRDWLIALIVLGVAAAAGVFHRKPAPATRDNAPAGISSTP